MNTFYKMKILFLKIDEDSLEVKELILIYFLMQLLDFAITYAWCLVQFILCIFCSFNALIMQKR